MRFQSYYNTAVYLIKAYDGSMPLVHFLKQYFAANKKHGSKDRKFIAHLCYVYYRLGHSLKPISIEAIQSGFTQTDQEMIDKAQESRNITAAASDQILANKAQEMGLKQKSGLEIEVVEEKRNAGDNSEKFEQTIEVVREGVQPIKSRGRKK